MALPEPLKDIIEQLEPGEPPREPPLPRWALHKLGLNPGATWIQEPDYRDDYERIAGQYSTWATKRAAVVCARGNTKCVEREAKALQAAHLASY